MISKIDTFPLLMFGTPMGTDIISDSVIPITTSQTNENEDCSTTPDTLPSLPGNPSKVNRSIRSRKWFITVWDQ